MITLKEWMEIAQYRITEGSDYYAWGTVYALTSWSGDHDGYSLEIIFNPKTQVVHQVQACDYKHQRAYRLTNPDTPLEGADNQAWDDVKWIDLEADDDWIQKALAIVAGEDYDTRVSVPIELSDEELLKYMKLAHEQDITFNQLIERAMVEIINKHDPNFLKNNK